MNKNNSKSFESYTHDLGTEKFIINVFQDKDAAFWFILAEEICHFGAEGKLKVS